MTFLDVRLRRPLARFDLDVELRLNGGGVTALTGLSGAGKSRLLQAVAGFDRAAVGRVQAGESLWQDDTRGWFVPPHRRRLGYIFQEPFLFPHLSVRRNLLFGYERVAGGERRWHPDEVIDRLDLAPLLDQDPADLSGGEKQRLCMGRSLLTSPRLWLLDEPLSALDPVARDEVMELMERVFPQLHLPVLYVSHSLKEVGRLADEVLVMDQGKIIFQGDLTTASSRADLPLWEREEPGVICTGIHGGPPDDWGLCRVETGDELTLWLPDSGHGQGDRIRLRIAARDVSLSLSPPADSSILNAIPCTVTAIRPVNASRLIVSLQAPGLPLLAGITRRSCDHLQLKAGTRVHALIKSIALADRF